MIPTSKLKKLILHQVAYHVENNISTDLPIWDIISKKISGEFGEISSLKVKEVFYKEVVPSLTHCNYGITSEATLNTIRKMSQNPMASTLPAATLAAADSSPRKPSHGVHDRMILQNNLSLSIEFTEITMETRAPETRSVSQSSDPLHMSSQVDYVVHSMTDTEESSRFEEETLENLYASSEAETEVTESTIYEQAEGRAEGEEEAEYLDYEYLIDYPEVAAADDEDQDQFEVSSSTSSHQEVSTTSEASEFPAKVVQQEVTSGSQPPEDPVAVIDTTTDPQVDNERNEDFEELRGYESLEFYSGFIQVATMMTPNTERICVKYAVLASPVVEQAPNDLKNSMASIPEVTSPLRSSSTPSRRLVNAVAAATLQRTPLSVRLSRIICVDSETSDDDTEAAASDQQIEAATESVAKKGDNTSAEATKCETSMSVKISRIVCADSDTSDDDNEAAASDRQIEAATESVAKKADDTSTEAIRCETPMAVKISRIICADSDTSDDEEAESTVQPNFQVGTSAKSKGYDDAIIVISDSEDEEMLHQVESAGNNGEIPVSPEIPESENMMRIVPDENDFVRCAKFTSTQIMIESPPLFDLPKVPTRFNRQKRMATSPITDSSDDNSDDSFEGAHTSLMLPTVPLPAKMPRIVPFAQAIKAIIEDRTSGRNKY